MYYINIIYVKSYLFFQLDDDSTPIDLSWPSSWKDRLAYVIRAPILFLMYFTAQDIRKPVSEVYHCLMVTFYFMLKLQY